MAFLDWFRRVVLRAEDAMNEVDYRVIEEIHDVEHAIDERTGGRLSDLEDEIDAGAAKTLEKLHLDGEPDQSAAS